MEVSVSNQCLVFLSSVVFGGVLGFWYDFFRIMRKSMKTGRVAAIVEDSLFWIVATAATFFFIFITNSGEIRFFIFIGAAIGSYLYFLTLSKPVIAVSVFVVNLAKTVVGFILRVLMTPLRLAMRPARRLSRLAVGKTRQVVKSIKKKWGFWLKTLKISIKNKQKDSKPID
jgi:spore cortex biosynthesis protein YabQ